MAVLALFSGLSTARALDNRPLDGSKMKGSIFIFIDVFSLVFT